MTRTLKLEAAVDRARRAHYRAANPSEATMRRETHCTDLTRREERVRRLKARYEELLQVLADSRSTGRFRP